MPANFIYFLSYLENITHTFWPDRNMVKTINVLLYGVTGYNHTAVTRSHGKGSCAILLISDVFVYSELTEMCKVSDYI